MERPGGAGHWADVVSPPAAAVGGDLSRHRAGLQDAKAGRPLYGWSILHDPAHRAEFLKDGWKDIAKVFCLAVLLDVVYQVIVLRWVWPGEVLLVAFLLAFLPYLLIRGPVNRLAPPRRAAAGSNQP